eukprot:8591351-Alexandrium_andersonii.AAC.1
MAKIVLKKCCALLLIEEDCASESDPAVLAQRICDDCEWIMKMVLDLGDVSASKGKGLKLCLHELHCWLFDNSTRFRRMG